MAWGRSTDGEVDSEAERLFGFVGDLDRGVNVNPTLAEEMFGPSRGRGTSVSLLAHN